MFAYVRVYIIIFLPCFIVMSHECCTFLIVARDFCGQQPPADHINRHWPPVRHKASVSTRLTMGSPGHRLQTRLCDKFHTIAQPYSNAHRHTYRFSDTKTHDNTHNYTYTCTNTHTHLYTHIHTYAYIPTHTNTHTHIHTHTYIYMYIYIYIYTYI